MMNTITCVSRVWMNNASKPRFGVDEKSPDSTGKPEIASAAPPKLIVKEQVFVVQTEQPSLVKSDVFTIFDRAALKTNVLMTRFIDKTANFLFHYVAKPVVNTFLFLLPQSLPMDVPEMDISPDSPAIGPSFNQPDTFKLFQDQLPGAADLTPPTHSHWWGSFGKFFVGGPGGYVINKVQDSQAMKITQDSIHNTTNWCRKKIGLTEKTWLLTPLFDALEKAGYHIDKSTSQQIGKLRTLDDIKALTALVNALVHKKPEMLNDPKIAKRVQYLNRWEELLHKMYKDKPDYFTKVDQDDRNKAYELLTHMLKDSEETIHLQGRSILALLGISETDMTKVTKSNVLDLKPL